MRTGPRTLAASGAVCSGEPRPGPGQPAPPAGTGLCRGAGAGAGSGPFLRPAAAFSPGAGESGVGGGVGRFVLGRRGGVFAALCRRHRGRGAGLRLVRQRLGRYGLLPFAQPRGPGAGGLAGPVWGLAVGLGRPPGAFFGAAGKKNLDFFQKTLSFLEKMVYNNRETRRRVRKAESENTKGRRPGLV